MYSSLNALIQFSVPECYSFLFCVRMPFQDMSLLYLHYHEQNFQFPDSYSLEIYCFVFYPTFAAWPIHVPPDKKTPLGFRSKRLWQSTAGK